MGMIYAEEQREEIYEIIMDVYANYKTPCEAKCRICEYADRSRCGMLVGEMARRLYEAGYRPTEKGGVEEYERIAINKAIDMIDDYLQEPNSIAEDWVMVLKLCRQALREMVKK